MADHVYHVSKFTVFNALGDQVLPNERDPDVALPGPGLLLRARTGWVLDHDSYCDACFPPREGEPRAPFTPF